MPCSSGVEPGVILCNTVLIREIRESGQLVVDFLGECGNNCARPHVNHSVVQNLIPGSCFILVRPRCDSYYSCTHFTEAKKIYYLAQINQLLSDKA